MMRSEIMLDAGGIFLLVIPILFLAFMAGVIFLEGWILTLFKYGTYKRACLHALIVNIGSLIAGFIAMAVLKYADLGKVATFAIFFLVTVVVEIGMLILMNKGQMTKPILVGGLLMNVASYCVLAFLLLAVDPF